MKRLAVTGSPQSVKATTVGSWSWLEPNSSTLLLLHRHGNLGAAVGGSTYTQMRSNVGSNSLKSYKYHQRAIPKHKTSIGV